MAAGIGASLRLDKDGRMVVASMTAKGTARSSGMIHEGDAILKVDKQWTEGMSIGDVQALFRGPPESLIKIKYARGAQEMTVTLTRETGNEHVLQQEHHLGGKRKLTPAEEEDLRRRQQAENMYHGIEGVNKERHKTAEDKMTAEELAEYKARRKAEDEENYRQSEAFHAKQLERDRQEALAEEQAKATQQAAGMAGAAANMFHIGGKHPKVDHSKQENKGGWHMPHFGGHNAQQAPAPPEQHKQGGGWHTPHFGGHNAQQAPPPPQQHKQGGGWHMPNFGRQSSPQPPPPQRAWYDFSPQTDAERRHKDERAKSNLFKAAAGYQANKMEKKWEQTVKKDNKVDRANCFDFGNSHANSKKKEHPGEHEWPWEVRGDHDDKWLNDEVHVPFFDDFFGGKKDHHKQKHTR